MKKPRYTLRPRRALDEIRDTRRRWWLEDRAAKSSRPVSSDVGSSWTRPFWHDGDDYAVVASTWDGILAEVEGPSGEGAKGEARGRRAQKSIGSKARMQNWLDG